MANVWKNKLYFGDNLDILRKYISDESVDLIYLDPPFNSNATYNVLFQEKSGEKSAAQITAFEDTWHWGQESEYAYQEIVRESPKQLADLIQAFRMFLGQNDMMAYLTMMAQRMSELHRVLKPTGSIYLHCDPTASHYLKLLMDAVFSYKNFRNEIVWCYGRWISLSKAFQRNHDIIFRYSKTNNDIFNIIREIDEKRQKTLDRGYTTNLLHNGERQLIVYKGSEHKKNIKELIKKEKFVRVLYREPEGNPIKDWWAINIIHPKANERLGYPTQKPEALLERIISASSNEGDLVLDPFCGCGTSIAVAERLHRRWIGIDITHLAITLMRHRLHDAFRNDLSPYEIIGQPKDLESARALAQESEYEGRYQFEWWALGLVDARPVHDRQKGSDKGIDGYINFFDDNSGKAKTIIVQVKSGHVSASHIRDLKGVLEREKAQIGVYITLEEPTKPMIEEAAAAGFYEPEHWPGNFYPRIQILTIQELLRGNKVDYPQHAPVATFKKAQSVRKANNEEQNRLL